MPGLGQPLGQLMVELGALRVAFDDVGLIGLHILAESAH